MTRSFLLLFLIALSLPTRAEEAGTSNLPPDPFGNLPETKKAAPYPVEVDRTRGSFQIDAEDGTYTPGSHFANWFWTMKAERWGNYHVGLVYESSRPKLGIQMKIGDQVLKGYAPRTNELNNDDPMILGTVYLPEPGEYPVQMLTGDQSNVPAFMVKGVRFLPAPESETIGQSIDGRIELDAKHATTYSEKMRYEPNEEKLCLGWWTEKEDWAEWVFDVSAPGEFELKVTYGCGTGAEGSDVAVYVNDQTRNFTVEDTGGFQNWKEISLGKVSVETEGVNRIAVIPQSKGPKAVMDIRRIVLEPAS